MLSCCLKCIKNTENVGLKVLQAKNGMTMLSSKCAICGSKKLGFMKQQEAKGILASLVLKTPLSKIPFLVTFCFGFIEFNSFNVINVLIVVLSIKMNKVVN